MIFFFSPRDQQTSLLLHFTHFLLKPHPQHFSTSPFRPETPVSSWTTDPHLLVPILLRPFLPIIQAYQALRTLILPLAPLSESSRFCFLCNLCRPHDHSFLICPPLGMRYFGSVLLITKPGAWPSAQWAWPRKCGHESVWARPIN